MSAGNVSLTSAWYWKWCLKELFELLEEGDLLEFDMGLYKHWAIYVGNVDRKPSVIHRTNSGGLSGSVSFSTPLRNSTDGDICCQTVEEVTFDRKVRINNSFDKSKPPRSKQDMLRDAWNALKGDASVAYCIITSNCEHLAKGIRNGTETSQQVQQVGVGLGAAAFGVLLGVGAAYCMGSYLDNRNRDEEEEEELEPRQRPMLQ